MMTFEQHLNEVFDRAVPWKIVKVNHNPDTLGGSDRYEVEFKINNVEFHVDLIQYGDPLYTSINFKIINNGIADYLNYRPSGSNEDQFKVYSTILDVFKTFVREGKIIKGSHVRPEGAVYKQDKTYAAIGKYLVKKGVLVADGTYYGALQYKVV